MRLDGSDVKAESSLCWVHMPFCSVLAHTGLVGDRLQPALTTTSLKKS